MKQNDLRVVIKRGLRLAVENHIQSIAFPSISTGIYGYPTEKAAVVALTAVKELVLQSNAVPTTIQFILFDEATHTCYVDALIAVFQDEAC